MNEDHFGSNNAAAARSNYSARSAVAERSQFAAHPNVNPHPGPRPNPDWHHGNWHDNWNHEWNHWPAGWWGAGLAAGLAFDAVSAPWAWGYLPYSNPYCGAPVVVDGASIDYSQPIAMAAPTGGDSDSQSATEQATSLLDAAHDAFLQGNYAGALSQCDKAIAVQPNDALLHEFRGLALFALHRYNEAAGAVYAVLSAGPGWDWTTVSGLYPDISVYTEQLRALEKYANANPNLAAARFLLAYHYMICGHNDAAADQLRAAVQLDPKDRLSAQLLSMLTPASAAPQPTPTAPAKPVEAAALVGDWKATRVDGATIALSLTKDGKYTWKFGQKGKTQEFTGPYSVADNLLILKKGDTPVMVGQVSGLPNGQFNFKLPGGDPNDPGLTFGK
jgi:tetratricopeptide (TPR) repeat protein